MTIDEDIAQEAVAADERFDAMQPQLIAELRRIGVSDAEMPEALAYAHAEYWRHRCDMMQRLRAALLDRS